MITVQLLGGASLRSDDVPLTGPPTQRHRIALLALAVVSWPQPLSRDRAMALLWPERDLAGARRLLNLAIHVLRGALGEATIASSGDGLLFNPSTIQCDLHNLRAAIAAKAADRIVQHYPGVLLEGFHLAESAEFGQWLDQQRAELLQSYVGALREVAEQQEGSDDVHGRVATLRRLVAVDPHSGTSVRALMRALDASGNRAAALRLAEEHAQRLKQDLDMDADPGVMALAEAIRTAPAPPIRRGGPYARQPAVAVLPFINLDDNPDHDYFADGITEDVIAHLSKIRTLQVIARSSVLPFRNRQQSLKEIGATLGATKLLDGSVRHAGDRVRIVVSLVDVLTDRHLWGETYDRQVTDIFAIQTDVALHIAAALQARLSPEERSRVLKRPTEDMQAYRLFLQGRRWFTQYATEGYARAIEYIDRAIARDPTFALAWATIAMVHGEGVEIGLMKPEEGYRHAGEAVAQALALDPDLGEAHLADGYLRCLREFDWDGAERSFKRALELSPSSSDAFDLYGRMCAGLERYDDAIALLERAQELDPIAHRVDIATALLRAGRYDQATQRAQEAAELDPDQSRAQATLGWAHFLSGRESEGLAHLERAVETSGRNSLWLGQLGQAYGLLGRKEKAEEVLHELETQSQAGYVSPYHFVYVHVGLGDLERAMDRVEQVVDERSGPVYGIKGSFLLAPLHQHPRFQAIMRRIHL